MPTCTWSLSGLSERESTLLVSLMGLASGRTRANWERRPGHDVDLIFCNPDEASRIEAAASRQVMTRAIPVSVLGIGQKVPREGFALPAPVKIGSFFSLLEDVEELVLARLLAPEAGRKAAAPAESGRDPAHEFLRAIGRCLGSPMPGTVRMSVGPGWIDIDAERRLYRASAPIDVKFFAPLAVPIDMPDFRPIAERLDEGECESLERLLWLCCLLDRTGSLLPGLDERRAYKLGQWPDLGVVVEAPRFVKLCAPLVLRAMSAGELARATRAPVEDVHRLLNVCQSLGILVAVDARPISALLPQSSPVHASAQALPAGVLDRIRGALRIVWR